MSTARRLQRKQVKKIRREHRQMATLGIRRRVIEVDPNYVQLYHETPRPEDHSMRRNLDGEWVHVIGGLMTQEDVERGLAMLADNAERKRVMTESELALLAKWNLTENELDQVELMMNRGAKLLHIEETGELRVIIPSQRFGTMTPVTLLRFPRPQ